jgi:hypothetical protein
MTITRRFLVISSAVQAFGLGILGFGRTVLAAEQDQSVQFSWELPNSDAKPLARRLGISDKNISPAPGTETDRGVPIVVIIVGIVALVVLVKEIIAIYRDLKYGGLVIEDRGKRLVIRNDPRLPGRVIVVKDKRGVAIHELKGDISASELLKALPSEEPVPATKP